MQKVKVKFTRDSIHTACELWKEAVNSITEDREQLKNKSIAEIVLKKLRKKQVDMYGQQGAFLTMSFEVHEAVVLEELLRPIMYHNTTIYQQAQIRNIIDVINQKTA